MGPEKCRQCPLCHEHLLWAPHAGRFSRTSENVENLNASLTSPDTGLNAFFAFSGQWCALEHWRLLESIGWRERIYRKHRKNQSGKNSLTNVCPHWPFSDFCSRLFLNRHHCADCVCSFLAVEESIEHSSKRLGLVHLQAVGPSSKDTFRFVSHNSWRGREMFKDVYWCFLSFCMHCRTKVIRVSVCMSMWRNDKSFVNFSEKEGFVRSVSFPALARRIWCLCPSLEQTTCLTADSRR